MRTIPETRGVDCSSFPSGGSMKQESNPRCEPNDEERIGGWRPDTLDKSNFNV